MRLKRQRTKLVERKKVGRPKLPEDQKQKYQRVALYPQTHKRIKRHSKKENKNIIDWMEDYIPE